MRSIAQIMAENPNGYKITLDSPEERICRSCSKPFTAQYRPQWVCSECVHEHESLLVAAQLREKRQQEREWLSSVIGLEGELVDKRLEAFVPGAQPGAFQIVDTFLAEYPRPKSRNLIFLGETGSGKTHLACGILLELARGSVWGRYVRWSHMVVMVRSAGTGREEVERQLLAPLLSAPVVVLDDVGREGQTEYLDTWKDALFDTRYISNRPTIITGNVDRKGLTDWMGRASTSRVMSSAEVVDMAPVDARWLGLQAQVAKRAEHMHDPTIPCKTCGGAGWVRLESRPVFGGCRAGDLLTKCPSCGGDGY
jgi:DNA replication protein DnaC